MHGMSGGLMNVLGGGEFGSGFASGVVSSLISSVIQARVEGKNFATNNPGAFKAIMIASGGLSGGFSSTIAGGKFVDGFRQGIITSGLNHLVHMGAYDQQPKKPWDTDGDGKISLSEANEWYRNGGGKPITVDASSVDLNFVDTTGWVKGNTYGIQTLFSSEQGRVFGNIRVEYLGNNQVKILSDTYNFEQHGSYLSSPIRNPANSVGRWVAGDGIEYKINFTGVNTITPRVYNFERGPKY